MDLVALRMLHITLRMEDGYHSIAERGRLEQKLADIAKDAAAPVEIVEAAIDVLGNLFVQMPSASLTRRYILRQISAILVAEELRRGDPLIAERVMWSLSNLLYVDIDPFPTQIVERAVLYLQVGWWSW